MLFKGILKKHRTKYAVSKVATQARQRRYDQMIARISKQKKCPGTGEEKKKQAASGELGQQSERPNQQGPPSVSCPRRQINTNNLKYCFRLTNISDKDSDLIHYVDAISLSRQSLLDLVAYHADRSSKRPCPLLACEEQGQRQRCHDPEVAETNVE